MINWFVSKARARPHTHTLNSTKSNSLEMFSQMHPFCWTNHIRRTEIEKKLKLFDTLWMQNECCVQPKRKYTKWRFLCFFVFFFLSLSLSLAVCVRWVSSGVLIYFHSNVRRSAYTSARETRLSVGLRCVVCEWHCVRVYSTERAPFICSSLLLVRLCVCDVEQTHRMGVTQFSR